METGISYLLTAALGLRLVDSEILSRTHPSLLDLGVAIAAGAIGAFAYARPRIANAVPGVAIAVALVPPLCVVGVALASGVIGENMSRAGGHGQNMAAGAFLLFAANVVGILFSASVVFLLHGYGQLRKGIVSMTVLALGLCLVVWPLDYSFRNLYAKAEVHRSIERLRLSRSTLFDGRSEMISLDVVYHQDSYHVQLDIVVPSDELADFSEKIHAVSEALSDKLNRPVQVEAKVIPATYIRSASGSGG